MTRPQPDLYPISEGVMGLPQGGYMRTTTELYFPFNFSCLECKVAKFEIKLKNMRQMVINIDFYISGDPAIAEELYKDETWKLESGRNFFKFRDHTLEVPKKPLPIFALMLNKYLKISDATLKIDGVDSAIAFDQTPDIILMPNSYPPNEIIPETEQYVFYDKKSTVFYSNLQLGKVYQLTIELESIATHFEFAPLFPFGKTQLSKIELLPSDELEYEAMFFNVNPKAHNKLPQWLEEKFERRKSLKVPTRAPNLKPANPYRGEEVLFPPDGNYGMPTFTTVEDVPDPFIEHVLTEFKDQELNNYTSVRIVFGIIIPPGKETDIIVRIPKNPLPSRIYEQLQSLPGYDDVLIEYDIFNLSHKNIRLKIETEIPGITDKSIKRTIIHKINNNNNQKARSMIRDCPKLKTGILKTLVNNIKSTLHCKIIDEDTKDTLYEETFEVEFLPQDQMVWSLKDVRNSNGYNLAPFIGAWIYPNDQEGLLDKVRAQAARLHPDNALGHHDPGNLDELKLQIKAIYEHLTNEGFTYVSQPFTSRPHGDSQRVLLPEKVLENKVGNCIDLSVLFASILEGLGIYSLIFLTPNHAFIGWGNPRRTEEMLILETTVIGGKTFEEALEIGKDTFKRDFLFIGLGDPLPGDITYHSNGCQIIQLSDIRKQGINTKQNLI